MIPSLAINDIGSTQKQTIRYLARARAFLGSNDPKQLNFSRHYLAHTRREFPQSQSNGAKRSLAKLVNSKGTVTCVTSTPEQQHVLECCGLEDGRSLTTVSSAGMSKEGQTFP